MNDQSTNRDSLADQVVADLFSTTRVSSSELSERLYTMPKEHARQLLVDRLTSPELSERHGPLILAVLDVIGIGNERDRLTRVALDGRTAPRTRTWAAMALAGRDPHMIEMLIGDLGPDGLAELAAEALAELLTIQGPEKAGTTILKALQEWHLEPASEKLLGRIESCRISLGITCVEAYGETLCCEQLESVFERLLDYFIEEASGYGIDFLEQLKQRSPRARRRRKLQSALLRMRSARITPGKTGEDLRGRALVSNCDGQGGFLLLGIFENSDATSSLSELYIRADGGIAEGVVHGRIDSDETKRILGHHQRDGNCLFVETSLGEALSLIRAAIERAGEPSAARPETRQALTLFRRVLEEQGLQSKIRCSPTHRISDKAIRSLLSRPEYVQTWIFDSSDLERLDALESFSDSKIVNNNNYLNDSRLKPLQRRLTAMAEHMAAWHYFRGEPEEASLCLALRNDVNGNLAESLLVELIRERSLC
jgi:hypothetical protein